MSGDLQVLAIRALYDAYTPSLRAQGVASLAIAEGVAAVIDALTPLIWVEPSHLIEHIRAIEDDTEGWHITAENHAGLSVRVYAATWSEAMEKTNAQAEKWLRAQHGDLEPIAAGEGSDDV
jgi:hypothetical protein